MSHLEAVGLEAVDKYFLEELSPTDRDRFEEHYFDCPICAEDVRSTSLFVDNLKAVLKEPYAIRQEATVPAARPPAPAASRWMPRMGIAAAVALLAVASYQNGIVIPQLRHEISQAEAPAAFSPQFIAETRSESHEIEVLPTQRTVDLVFSKNPLWTSSTYSCELKSADMGRSVFTASIGVPEGDEWGLSFPAKGLRSGTYILRVTGVKPVPDASEVTQYQFKLNVK